MKRNNMWKQITALALAAILCVPAGVQLGGGAKIAEASTGNLVANGDFDSDSNEMDAAGWSLGEGGLVFDDTEYFVDPGFDGDASPFVASNVTQAIVADPVDSDDTCLQMQATANNGYVGYDFRNLTAGETYNVSFKVYVGTTTSTENLQAYVVDRGTAAGNPPSYHLGGGKHNSTDGAPVTAKNISGKGWVTYSCDVTAREDLSYWTLRIQLSGVSTVWYMDDVSVKHVQEYAENGTFDDNADGWSTDATMTWGAANGNGDGGVQVTNTAKDQWIRTYVPVVGGQKYRFSFWFKCTDANNTRMYTTVIQRAENKSDKTYDTDYRYENNNIGNSVTAVSYLMAGTLKPDTTWRIAVGEFTAAPETVYAEIRLRLGNSTGTVYFDDFSCTSIASEMQDGVVLNGDDYEMMLIDEASVTYADAALTADTYYDYRFDVTKDETITRAGLLVDGAILAETTGTFKYIEGEVGFATEGEGTAYFDNLSIVAHTHEGGEATCEQKAVCDKCTQEYGELEPHTDADNDELCDECSFDLHVHELAPTWYQEDGKHFQKCVKETCDYTSEPEPCSGGTATCKKTAVCTTCGKAYGTKNASNHAHGSLRATSVQAKLYGDYDDVRVTWKAAKGATGYKVYYKISTAKSYKYAGYTTKTYFVKKNLSDGVKYTFAVRAQNTEQKVTCYDSYRAASAIYTLKKVSTPKVTKSSSSKVKVSWTNISAESGYQISQSTSKSKTKIVSTYSTTSGKSKTIKAAKKKTYYYKVRAYKTVDGKKIYGPWSNVKSYKLK